MDKQRIIEIAHEIARRNEEKLGHNNPQNIRLYGEPVRMIKLIDGGINEFAAAILLEAADICQQVSEGNDTSAEYCQYRLEQLAKELTK